MSQSDASETIVSKHCVYVQFLEDLRLGRQVSHPLVIRPEAEDDLADARDWYDAQRDGLGLEFLAAVEDEPLP